MIFRYGYIPGNLLRDGFSYFFPFFLFFFLLPVRHINACQQTSCFQRWVSESAWCFLRRGKIGLFFVSFMYFIWVHAQGVFEARRRYMYF